MKLNILIIAFKLLSQGKLFGMLGVTRVIDYFAKNLCFKCCGGAKYCLDRELLFEKWHKLGTDCIN